jgi:hypothetical protein
MVGRRFRDRLKALRVYALRAILNSRTNAPFISGDGIANLCELSMYSPIRKRKVPSTSEVSNAVSIFVPGHKLDEFLLQYEHTLKAKVLVVGNSDRDYFTKDFSIPSTVKFLLLQNSHISDDFIETLPIGIENLRFGRNGFRSYFNYLEKPKLDKILVGPFSNTHTERREIESLSSTHNPRVVVLDKYVSPKKLADLANKYSFVACPRGNGTDTHRFWETLYRGSIPIVKKSAWAQSLKIHNLPFIEVELWSPDEVIEKVNRYEGLIPFNPREIPALWLPYWENLIKLNSK